MTKPKQRCSFCEKSQDDVEILVVERHVGICGACIKQAAAVVERYQSRLLDEVRRFGT